LIGLAASLACGGRNATADFAARGGAAASGALARRSGVENFAAWAKVHGDAASGS
jgi:hypothetical protein